MTMVDAPPVGREYDDFLQQKAQSGASCGFAPICLPASLFDFQAALVEWALLKGRAAIFADCGLGKTLQQLVWADNVVQHTNRAVLIISPLAVAAQTAQEAQKFGIAARRSDSYDGRAEILITNYERLHYFNAADFAGAVCDESSILKSFNGVRRGEITEFMRKMPYRLLCTATAAPNDYTELGTSSEALGYLGYVDMLNRFFVNQNRTSGQGRFFGESKAWRFKGHASKPYWRWVSSWARAIRRPSDLGFNDHSFVLPPLHEREHIVETKSTANGMLFELPSLNLQEHREERRNSMRVRCERAAELVATQEPALIWCDLNDEADLLEALIPDAVQVSGRDTDESKEQKFLGFVRGDHRVLVTKKKIGAWGLNFQHCSHEIYFPSYSFEQYYQAVRRCWRFGQQRPVTVDIVATKGEHDVLERLHAKSVAADQMFSEIVTFMNDALAVRRDTAFSQKELIPAWL